MTDMPPQAFAEFRANDRVRLVTNHGDVRPGTLGRILGRFAREACPTYVVSFEGDRPHVAGDVRVEEIVLVDDLRASTG
jgi:hypothetical protein